MVTKNVIYKITLEHFSKYLLLLYFLQEKKSFVNIYQDDGFNPFEKYFLTEESNKSKKVIVVWPPNWRDHL